MTRLTALLGIFALASVASAERMELSFRSAASGIVHTEQPVLMGRSVAAKSIITETLPAPVSAHFVGNEVGIVRDFMTAAAVTGNKGLRTYRSVGAARVRLHLRFVSFGVPAVMWVAGSDGPAIPFGPEAIGPDRSVWTPSVAGDTINLEWSDGSDFSIDAIGHIQPTPESTVCFLDEACSSFPDKTAVSSATGQIVFANGASFFICTGALINDRNSTDRLFLTANHCISTAAEAASVDISWDDVDSSCGANNATRSKRTTGATLVATSAVSDVTLLRLSSLPAGRYALGWTTEALAAGTTLRRVSHPGTDAGGIFPQRYSSSAVYSGTTTCQALSRPAFLYSTPLVGAVGGGSSGSPTIIDGGYIVGQLFGGCGPDPSDNCSPTTKQVDGSFAVSYSLLQPYLDPAPPTPSCAACTPNNNTACLLGNRFKATMTWHDFSANQSGNGTVVRYADNLPDINAQYGPMSEISFFSMYPSAPKSVEVFVRMFRGVGINNKFWVFLSSLASAEHAVTVTDTQTCQTWTRTIATGSTTTTKDFDAFPFP